MRNPFNVDSVNESWHDFFFRSDVVDILESIDRAMGGDYYPTCENVLRFAQNDLDCVKHVIVGMDPYPSWNAVMDCPQATGRSFEVSEIAGKGWDYKIKQSSLRNILKALHYNETGRKASLSEIRSEIETGSFEIVPPKIWFDEIERQGVLFLNSTLTVRPDEPGSHREFWRPFRELFLPYLSGRSIKWHLWGKDAQSEYGSLLVEGEDMLMACHPRLAAFVEENTFAQAEGINWLGSSVGELASE